MRIALVVIITCLLFACGGQQSNIERAFIDGGDAARAARAELDAQAILRGMEQARRSDERVARALDGSTPDSAPAPLTR